MHNMFEKESAKDKLIHKIPVEIPELRMIVYCKEDADVEAVRKILKNV
jgi:hypothetical protein